MSGYGHVAIIGGGFAGTLQALALLRAGIGRISLIERRPAFARGVAYATENPAHLLNVRTGNMSAVEDDPDHFRRWLAARGGGDAAGGFASRRDYGDYLAGLLAQARAAMPDRLNLVHDQAVEVECRPDGVRVGLDGAPAIAADAAILAIGTLPPHDPLPAGGPALPHDLYAPDPWDDGIGEGLRADDRVLLIGTGLTMVDMALALAGREGGARVTALSRHGLLPLSHDHGLTTWPAGPRPRDTGAALVRRLRADARARGWRAAVDGRRPHTQTIWRDAPAAEQARFIRHLRPWWDVHRHRLAPAVAARVATLRESGRLGVVAGRITGAAPAGRGVAVDWRPRGQAATETLHVRRIVNCTGPQGDLLRTREPLLHLLLASGRVRPDRHRLGIDVNRDGETLGADGRANRRLLAVGPMTRGAFWEIVAVPDIRVQAWGLARRLGDAA